MCVLFCYLWAGCPGLVQRIQEYGSQRGRIRFPLSLSCFYFSWSVCQPPVIVMTTNNTGSKADHTSVCVCLSLVKFQAIAKYILQILLKAISRVYTKDNYQSPWRLCSEFFLIGWVNIEAFHSSDWRHFNFSRALLRLEILIYSFFSSHSITTGKMLFLLLEVHLIN